MDDIFKKIFTTKGRLNRLTHLKYQVIWITSVSLAIIIGSLTIEFLTGVPDSHWGQMIELFLTYVGFIGFFVIMVRRMHDLNLSGIFEFAIFVPVIGTFFLLYIFIAAGTVGANKYGEEMPDES